MTYEEFKKKIEEITSCTIGYDYNGDEIALECLEGLLARFNLKDERSYVVYYTNFSSLIDLDDDTVYKNIKELVEELVETPIEDRYPVKKYYVKLEALRFIDEEKVYLNRYASVFRTTRYVLDTKDAVYKGVGGYQTQFTMEEIKEIIPKEDMDKFKFIPVEED